MIETLELHGRELVNREVDIETETDSDGFLVCSSNLSKFICSACSKNLRYRNIGYIDFSMVQPDPFQERMGAEPSRLAEFYCHECLSKSSLNLEMKNVEGGN